MIDAALLNGLILGLTLAVLIGPVFFALLQTSIQRGFWAAALLALGISMSDAFYILITNIFVSFLTGNEAVKFFLGVFGGIILITIGIMTSLKKPVMYDETGPIGMSHFQKAKYFIKGFLLNFAHPGVLIFWLGVISFITAKGDYDTAEKARLYSATIATVFVTDLLKSFLASRIKKFISYTLLLWMNRVLGLLLVLFGMHLFLSTLGLVARNPF